jgi:hypothetical protein
MPCYDKKLEASRQDFYNDIYSTRDVDCVITTLELELMMQEKGWDLSLPAEHEDSALFASDDVQCTDLPELLSHPGTSSGSYLHSLISVIVATTPRSLDLSVRTVRTADYEEYTLSMRDTGEVVFRGAKCYGFRNLQNVVRKVGREAGVQVGKGAAGRLAGGLRGRARKAESSGKEVEKGYDYVEVMACPAGCVNGGGQLRPPRPATSQMEDEEGYKRNWEESGVRIGGLESESGLQNPKWGDKEWTKKVEEAYWHDLPTPPPSPKLSGTDGCRDVLTKHADRLVARILVDLCEPKKVDGLISAATMDDDAETRRKNLFRTQYHVVESEVVGLAVKW